jgi:D-aminopeptidase
MARTGSTGGNGSGD